MMNFPVMWLKKLLKIIIILTVIVRVLFIWYLVMCVVNIMLGLQQHRLITRANVKFIYRFDNKFFRNHK